VEVDHAADYAIYINALGIWINYRNSHGLYKDVLDARDRLLTNERIFGKVTNSGTLAKAFGYLYSEEQEFLSNVFRGIPLGIGEVFSVVNVGAGAGTSGLCFMESSPRVVLLTVDMQAGSSPYGCLEGERVAFAAAGQDGHAGSRWFQAHGASIDVGRVLRDGRDGEGVAWMYGNPWHPPVEGFAPVVYRKSLHPRYDVAFIDGDHSYGGCLGDLDVWGGMVAVGGRMLVHDYRKDSYTSDPRHMWGNVTKAVEDFLAGPGLREGGDLGMVWEELDRVGTIAVLRRVE